MGDKRVWTHSSENSDAIRVNLKSGQPMFFDGTDKPFRKAFQQRWYSDIKRQVKRLVRVRAGTYKGQTGSFVWTEEVK